MSVTGDAQTDIGTGSFWEVGQYKRTLKRIEDGNRLCNDLMNLIQERGEIEKAYSKNLRHWSRKWNDLITKGPEYGTTEAGCKSVLCEADRVAALHTNIRDELMNEVHSEVKSWQKASFHKPMMGPLKEIKDIEDAFKKAQKPWAKKLDRVVKCKKDYHVACRTEKTAKNQENNAKSDSSMSEDQRKKLEDKVQKLANDVSSTRERYEASLQDINAYNAKYMEDMTEVFDQCQEMEKKRLKFVQQTLFSVHKCLDLSADSQFPEIYKEFLQTIENADSQKDLKWWSNVHGADMPMNWPAFEEFAPELSSISKKQSKKDAVGSDGIMLTGIIHQRGNSNLSNSSEPPAPAYDTQISSNSATEVSLPAPITDRQPANDVPAPYRSDSTCSYDRDLNPFADDGLGDVEDDHEEAAHVSLNPFDDDDDSGQTPTPPLSPPTTRPRPVKKAQTSNVENKAEEAAQSNPFTDEFDDADGDTLVADGDALVDDGSPGVPVRALYDYDGAEDDELSFKAGDVIDKLEDEDEQGWCKGRKDKKVGLYPANYCENT